jgi:hypothetical protein
MTDPMWCEVRQQYCRCHDYGMRCEDYAQLPDERDQRRAEIMSGMAGGSSAAVETGKEKP